MSDIAPDTAGSSAITSHAFTPRGKWWTVCRVCGLAEAAHTNTTLNSVTYATLETDSEGLTDDDAQMPKLRNRGKRQ